jgi:tetratricopeptide (TPR) repeat protein
MDRWPRAAVAASVFLFCVFFLAGFASAATEFDRATRLGMSGDYDGAIREYQSFLERAPQDRLSPTAAMAIANLQLSARRDSAAAVPWLDRVVNDYPSSPWAPEAARVKGRYQESQKKWEEAGGTYMKAIDLASKTAGSVSDQWMNEVTLAAANSFFAAGDRPKQIETYQKVLKGSPPPEVAATSLYRLGESYEEEGNAKDAADCYAKVVREHPGSPIFETAMGKRPLIEGHVNVDWPPYTKYSEGAALVQQQDFQGALRTTDELLASNIDPPLRECLEYRKITLETALAGNYSEGCDKLRGYIARYPNGQRLATARRTLEQNWGPIAELETAAQEHPEEAERWRALGLVYVQTRLADKAIAAFEKSLAIDPEDPGTYLGLGYAYSAARRNEEATKAFDFYLERNPEDEIALNLIGYSYLGLGQPDRAIPYFERFVKVSPDDPNSHDSLGEGYLAAGRLDDAAREYEKAVEINPTFANSWFMLGRVYQQRGDKEKAITAYGRFLDITPGGPQADQARSSIDSLRKS